MLDNFLLLFMVLSLTVAVILIVVKIRMDQTSAKQDTIFVKGTHNKTNSWHKLYVVFNRVPFLRKYTDRVRKQLEMFFPGSEKLVVEMTCKIVLAIISLIAVLLVIVFLLHMTLYFIVCSVIAVIVANGQILQAIINRNNARLLGELDVLAEKVQFNFLQTRMIDEAIRDSLTGQLKLVEKHGAKILEMMDSDDLGDLDMRLLQYVKIVSNKFLREFMCICVTTFIYGDSEEDGESRFLQSLKSLKSRIGTEKRRMTAVNYNFKFLPIICIAPVFLLQLIANWAIGNVPELEAYYHGYYGMILMAVCFIASIAAYVMMNYLKNPKLSDLSDHKALEWIYRVPFIRKVINTYYNNNYGKYLQYDKMLRQTGSRLSVYTLMTKRMVYACVSFLMTFVFILGMNGYIKYHIDSQVTGTGSKSSMASETDSVIMMMMIRGYTEKYKGYDPLPSYNSYVMNLVDSELEASRNMNDDVREHWKKEMVEDFQLGTGCVISDEIALSTVYQYNQEHASSTKIFTAYLGSGPGEESEDEALVQEALKQMYALRDNAQGLDPLKDKENLYESIADDVIDRVLSYQNAYFHWYYTLIAIAISVIAYFVPYLWVLFTKRSSQQLMEEEVMQFQALILILMPIKSMSVDIMLDWMLKFSSIFRPSIHKCIVHLGSDEYSAFQMLLEDEPYEPLQDIVRKLQMCDRVGVRKAFYNMQVTHNNFCEYRKQSEELQLATNTELANMLVALPVMVTIMVYMVVPFITESFGQLNTTLQQLNTI